MKRSKVVLIALMAIILTICCTGCMLLANETDSLASGGTDSSSTSTSSSTTSSTMTKKQLEEALTKYQAIVESLSDRVDTLERLVEEAVVGSNGNIGAYASTLVDCVLNITCVESAYSNLACQGSGFIITEDGYVITNNHVVYYETSVYEPISSGWITRYNIRAISGEYSSITGMFDQDSIYYQGGKVYELQFVYRDPDCDLALCKLVETPTSGKWSAIPFYGDKTVRGDEVLVLGNADGFGLSATAGLVSATGKTFTDYEKATFIQTDAAINGGNSGGPAINIYGALIGVVNSKFVSTNIENMGFAIELNVVKSFIADAETAKGITVGYTTKSSKAAVEEAEAA